ncbi:MAG: vitamin K epoxide reductase family protein [Candidatus Sulfotelmatobacter sp.]
MSAPAQLGSAGKAKHSNLMLAIAILSFAGMVLSAVSLQRHYARSATAYCDFGERFSCDIVNRSEYSSVAGVPVAGIGLAGYAALLILAAFYRDRDETPLRLVIMACVGLAFALYLTYIEAYVLSTWCILCLGSLTVIFVITLLAVLACTVLPKTE